MSLTDNRRLYDIAVRHQIYVEGVKLFMSRQFNEVQKELTEEYKKLLPRSQYQTMDGLSKAKLQKLLRDLKDVQKRVYSAYTEKIIEMLKDFMAVDLSVTRLLYAVAKKEEDDDEEDAVEPFLTGWSTEDVPTIDDDALIAFFLSQGSVRGAVLGLESITTAPGALWSTITATPMGANGLLVLPFLRGFTTSASAFVEMSIAKAWVNKTPIDVLLAELIGPGLNGVGGMLGKTAAQWNSVISTAIQFVTSVVTNAVSSAVYKYYTWHSVMDNRTTDICRGLNGKTFVYGKGPLPPAHINCRSTVAPSIMPESTIPDEGVYNWLRRQPASVVRDILDPETASKLKDDNTKASDLPKYQATKALTFKQFRQKILKIIKR